MGPAQERYATGDRLAVAAPALWTIGLEICAGNLGCSLALGDTPARTGARCSLCPRAWAVPADHEEARRPHSAAQVEACGRVAALDHLTVVGGSNVGGIEAGPRAGPRPVVLARGLYNSDVQSTAHGMGFALLPAARGYQGP